MDIVNMVMGWILPLAGAAIIVAILRFSGVIRYISNSRIAIVEKLWSGKGSIENGLIALQGEAGFQPDVLRGGFHFFMPFQYRLHPVTMVTIPQGQIGYVFARDGKQLEPTQALASNVKASDFQNARDFLASGGQKGPQRRILREGTYAINLALFVVFTRDHTYGLRLDRNEEQVFENMKALIAERDGFTPVVIKDNTDSIGVVTVHDGPALAAGEIIAPSVGTDAAAEGFHNNFQDVERFLEAGGRRGRQHQVLVEGSYYVNRLFATVELIQKTVIEVGHVGVVVSYVGDNGLDQSGDDYRHGELVEVGKRGVWKEPLLPGKYAFNTYAGRVMSVPTTNFILKWSVEDIGSHKFDENLAEVDLITRDAFEPTLPLSVVVHIDYRKAPLVVQRFGDIKKLVEQTLDPMVSAYFKNVAQKRTLIELLQERSEIQEASGQEMKAKFLNYNLELQEVLIGTPSSGKHGGEQIEKILTQLRQRQIADEQIETYAKQADAAKKERELREAEARAKQQTGITESELSIMIQQNQGRAELARAEQEAKRIEALGKGEAAKVVALAEAEASRAVKIGEARALAIKAQVDASGGPQYQLTRQVAERFAEAIEKSGVDIVPKVQIGAEAGGSGNALTGLLTALLAGKAGDLGKVLDLPAEADGKDGSAGAAA